MQKSSRNRGSSAWSWLDRKWQTALQSKIATMNVTSMYTLLSRSVEHFSKEPLLGDKISRVRMRASRDLEIKRLRNILRKVESISADNLDSLLEDPTLTPSRSAAAPVSSLLSTPSSRATQSRATPSRGIHDVVDDSPRCSLQTTAMSSGSKKRIRTTPTQSRRPKSRKSRLEELQRRAMDGSSSSLSSSSSDQNSKLTSLQNQNVTPKRETLLKRSILKYFHHLVCELLRPVYDVPLYELCTFGATKMTLTRLLRMDYHGMMESRFLTGRGPRRSSKKRNRSGISAPVMYV